MAKFTKIPENAFKEIQLNAGILVSNFTPESAQVSSTDILGATSGGVAFSAVPSFVDFGEDIDNCPKNTKELKQIDSWEIMMSGTFVTVSAELSKKLIGMADVSTTKVTPRNSIAADDFIDLWWIGDYSDKNGETNGGYVAIHMMNSLSTAGFSLQSGDKTKGQFAFEFTAHFSISDQDTVPFEMYVKTGTNEV